MCTTIKLRNTESIILAQNYDFYYGHGLVATNKKGVSKVAIVDNLTKENIYSDENSGAQWVSKYGSITFNQFGREIPTCGMNEEGLAVVSMWHNTEQKPVGEGDSQITELQWIQMQLDLYTSVDEVINNLDKVSLGVKMYPMHYHCSDTSGRSVIVEIVNGRLKAFENKDISGCGNAGIRESVEYIEKYHNTEHNRITIKEPILDRAAKAILMSKDFNENSSSREIHSEAFNILDSVALHAGFGDLFRWVAKSIPPTQTFWQVMFDVSELKIYFKTKQNKKNREINLSTFDFSHKTPVKIFDIEKEEAGDISDKFIDYSRADNEKIVKKSFAPVNNEFPENKQNELIEYPEILKNTPL